MAVPTRRQVIKREKMKEAFRNEDKPKVKEKPVSPEEHQKKIELLKSLGLIKEDE